MTRKIATTIITLLAAVPLLAISVAAQDTSKLEEELPGVQAGYMRMFLPDPEATPVADLIKEGTTTHTVMFMAYRFDTPENAASALDTYAAEGMDQFFEGDTEQEEIADLGDKAVQVSGTTHVGDDDGRLAEKREARLRFRFDADLAVSDQPVLPADAGLEHEMVR